MELCEKLGSLFDMLENDKTNRSYWGLFAAGEVWDSSLEKWDSALSPLINAFLNDLDEPTLGRIILHYSLPSSMGGTSVAPVQEAKALHRFLIRLLRSRGRLDTSLDQRVLSAFQYFLVFQQLLSISLDASFVLSRAACAIWDALHPLVLDLLTEVVVSPASLS
jgi:hypothetical protein